MRLGPPAMLALRGALAALVIGALPACQHPSGVLRVVDGRIVEGPYVEPQAYAAFLRGAILEDSGDAQGALLAYTEAARYDQSDPEIWTRIAAVECKRDPQSVSAQVALERALAIDAEYAGAWGAKASCALARGEPAGEAAQRAVQADPLSDELQTLRARTEASRRPPDGAYDAGPDDAARRRLIALTLVHAGRKAAWEALAAWAQTHDDVPLFAHAQAELARRGLGDREVLIASAASLAGEGEIAEAREVAAALTDAPQPGLFADDHPLVARLAVDDALLAHGIERARLRATRTHLAMEEVAARALLLGDDRLARELAEPVAAADPADLGAALVLATCAVRSGDASAVGRAFAGPRGSSHPVSPAAALLFAQVLAQDVSATDAGRVLAALPHSALVPGDALLAPLAVELAARGVLAESELTLDAAVELAARRSQLPPAAALTLSPGLDLRHELLALALAEPATDRTRLLASRMARHAADPLVAVALARLELAQHPERLGASAASALLARNPGDPLVVAAALDMAKRRGDGVVIGRARAALTAVARTVAEQRLLE